MTMAMGVWHNKPKTDFLFVARLLSPIVTPHSAHEGKTQAAGPWAVLEHNILETHSRSFNNLDVFMATTSSTRLIQYSRRFYSILEALTIRPGIPMLPLSP